MSTALDFEKPIVELERKLQQLHDHGEDHPIEIAAELRTLRGELERLRVKRLSQLAPMQRVALARHPERPGTSDYLELLLEERVELHGDKRFRDDPAIRCVLGKLSGVKVLVIGQQKGKTIRERMACNFGMPHPEGYRKALDKMQLAAKCRLPILTLINCAGAACDIGAEERGQSHAIAVNLMEMAHLPTPIICCVIGEGGSGGALAIGVGDYTLMLEHAYYSVITPEGCASILFKDAAQAPAAAAALGITARDLLELGITDEVIPEPSGGAHRDPRAAAELLREVVLRRLRYLMSLSEAALLERRYAKLRRIGSVLQLPLG
jgi:acetyl-CoA carboxylase carboxyl transferase subunit alpha